jgi:hypothetical protein
LEVPLLTSPVMAMEVMTIPIVVAGIAKEMLMTQRLQLTDARDRERGCKATCSYKNVV